MPRKPEGPRLYLRKRTGRESVYVIRDGTAEIGTSCGEGSRQRAEQALATYIQSRYSPPTTETELKRLLVADIITIYLTEHAPSVVRPDFLKYTANSILAWWDDKKLSDVKKANCLAYVAWRTSQGVSDQTARHDLSTLRSAISYYHETYGPLPALPVVTLPAPSEVREDYHLTREMTAQRLRIARANKRYRHSLCRTILIGFYSGTRPGATFLLHWFENPIGGWVDLDRGIIHRTAKGASRRKKRQPKAKIHHRLALAMARWKRLDQSAGINVVVHYNGEPIKKLRRSWKAVALASGQLKPGEKEGPHIMRHTAVTWLLQSGVPKIEVAGFVGMSLEVLERVYGHHSPDYQETAATARGKRQKRTAPASPRIGVNESSTEVDKGAVIALKAPENRR